jgi:pyruvate, water dikinase
MELSRPLAQLRQSDAAVFGGKSACLGELLAAEIPVPPGFAISTEAYRAAMEQAEIDNPTPDAIKAASVPEAVRDEIARRYDELSEAQGEAQPAVAVRSSAVGEDSADATFAGLQETRLWVRGTNGVCDAVRSCWASLYSAPAVSYRERLGVDNPAMGVAVQVMVDAQVSGVMFTCNPVSGDPSMIAINASWGLGQAVVGGEVTPDDYLVSKITSEVVRQQPGHKDIQYVANESGEGMVRAAVAENRQDVACLDRPALAGLVDAARRVERHFGCHQDIEWVIARDGTLFIVQSRPATGVSKQPAKPEPASAIALVMSMFGANQARGDS